MPRRRITPKQAAASRRNLVKARAAKKRGTPVGKSQLPHVSWETRPYPGGGGKDFTARTYDRKGQITGNLSGHIAKGSKSLVVDSIDKRLYDKDPRLGYAVNHYSGSHPKAPTLEPGISLLTAAARQGRPMRVKMAVGQAKAFYALTGGTRADVGSGHFFTVKYSPTARRKLAGRRIVRVRKKK